MYYLWVCVSNGLHSDFFNSFFFQIDIFFFYSCVLLFVFVVVERERCRQKSKLSSVSAHFNFKVWMEFSSSPVMHDKYRNCLNHVIVCFVRKRIKHATAWRKKSINNDAVFSQIQLQSNYYNTYLWTEDEFFNVLDNHDELIFTLPEHVI